MSPIERILVVDDEPKACELLRLNLEPRGFSVSCATSAEEAIGLALAQKPDLIILDIRMKGKDGWSVCRMLKLDSLTQRVPVIMLTAYSSRHDLEKAHALGVAFYYTKPVDPDLLVESINSLSAPGHAVTGERNQLTQ